MADKAAQKPVLYLLPGLGADDRIFRRVRLRGYEKHFLNWEDPLAGDNLHSYAQRHCKKIDHSRPFVLIGVSMGAIMASIMAHYCLPQKVILVSGIREKRELAWYWRIFRWFPIYFLVPYRLLVKLIYYYRRLFGRSEPREARIYQDMLKQFSPKFFKWALHQVLKWKQEAPPEKVDFYRIQGTNDKLFPIELLRQEVFPIRDGDHFMIVHHGREIQERIQDIIGQGTNDRRASA